MRNWELLAQELDRRPLGSPEHLGLKDAGSLFMGAVGAVIEDDPSLASPVVSAMANADHPYIRRYAAFYLQHLHVGDPDICREVSSKLITDPDRAVREEVSITYNEAFSEDRIPYDFAVSLPWHEISIDPDNPRQTSFGVE